MSNDRICSNVYSNAIKESPTNPYLSQTPCSICTENLFEQVFYYFQLYNYCAFQLIIKYFYLELLFTNCILLLPGFCIACFR